MRQEFFQKNHGSESTKKLTTPPQAGYMEACIRRLDVTHLLKM